MSPACSALVTLTVQSLTELQIAEVCFYIMFKVRCHYFIQEINMLHKKGRHNKSILHCMLCWNFEFPLTACRRCVHVGYSGLKTAETLLIFNNNIIITLFKEGNTFSI